MSYQGWENYETWAVALWLDNTEGDQTYWQETAKETWAGIDEDSDNQSCEARSALEDRLKTEIEEAAPDLGATLWGDLMTSAIGSVNWREIADSMLSGADLEGYIDRKADTAA